MFYSLQQLLLSIEFPKLIYLTTTVWETKIHTYNKTFKKALFVIQEHVVLFLQAASVVTPQQSVLVNGQRQLLSPTVASSANANVATPTSLQAASSPNKFVVTSDYIQQCKFIAYFYLSWKLLIKIV